MNLDIIFEGLNLISKTRYAKDADGKRALDASDEIDLSALIKCDIT